MKNRGEGGAPPSDQTLPSPSIADHRRFRPGGRDSCLPAFNCQLTPVNSLLSLLCQCATSRHVLVVLVHSYFAPADHFCTWSSILHSPPSPLHFPPASRFPFSRPLT